MESGWAQCDLRFLGGVQDCDNVAAREFAGVVVGFGGEGCRRARDECGCEVREIFGACSMATDVGEWSSLTSSAMTLIVMG
ncbi:Uncharacterised protein [Mycobacteroides abscessus subsp. massiliense]|uniref:hypothetical protein n=1 Tax=Mycobacteroides abscessus TaxID=36809 RepID=UPI0009C9BDC4|nr:hypothetical protein [Mycobacteroides abscessus]SKQ92430.1 Uncharacterised protein [Mycobacteroides abscessus subsp. massiliense]SKR36433.1 Uncharacterised protein [Mycobacteroides abscessus subsp. massiliense]SKT84986.1 Uncharacterised protein [Mycobacteroides abscessus subsp. massiliense]SKU14056.1 Uncharacterised protein [Mycobacteroides abscessus subsp. massiliense]SLA37315.1 Uncharacterised protein [Mycobacteroides abscessus subsp. massiliense]